VDLKEKVLAADRGELPPDPGPALEVGRTPDGAVSLHLEAPPAELAAAVDAALWVGGVMQFGGLVKAVLPEKCAVRLDDARLAKIGAALAKVAAHYGWKWGGIFAHPVGGLLAECFPVAEPIAKPMIDAAFQRFMVFMARASPAPAPADDPEISAPPAPELVH
jgi:hypothetical protein